jgi:hypothetical protein
MNRITDRILAGIMGALSLICLIGTYQLWDGWDGPGTMPLIVGIIFLFLTIGFWVFPSKDQADNLFLEKRMMIHMGVTLASFAVYILLIGWLGYPLATWLLLIALVRSMKRGSIYKTLIWTGMVSIGTYIIFKTYLAMPLPGGFIGI